ncbi:CTB family bacteriocin, partial [Pelatocladus sp. BLCC-F211]|uniref:CTB family bacteriocin n=1 Tax=Pelatocladus sp. BLCC-F211 TaxID=3342752 RepID=UPI0035B99291
MSDENFTSNLFSEVAEEQQQMVAGGKSIYDNLSTYFNADTTAFAFKTASGPGGSVVTQEFAEQEINTGAYKTFELNPYYYP